MNERPHATTTYPERQEADASFQERPSNQLPAARTEQQEPPIPERASPEREDVVFKDTGFDKLAAAIANVMAEIQPVEKEGLNKFHDYKYARMQDLSRELTPLMGKHGIVIFQTEEGRELFDAGRAVAVRYRFTIVHKSGQVWPEHPIQTGLSNCRTTKGTFDDKTLNKCHTSARKYFLLSLFQIPTADEDDADHEEGSGKGTPSARPVTPSPTGKYPPHVIPHAGEAPENWARRFKGFIDKTENAGEVDKWYNVNAGVFNKLKGFFPTVYNDLLSYMDARAAFHKQKADPISSGPPRDATATMGGAAGAGQAGVIDFPGDRPMRPQAPPPSAVNEWLEALENAYAGCEDATSLAEAQATYMTPYEGKVSKELWQKAVALTKYELKRVESN